VPRSFWPLLFQFHSEEVFSEHVSPSIFSQVLIYSNVFLTYRDLAMASMDQDEEVIIVSSATEMTAIMKSGGKWNRKGKGVEREEDVTMDV
jgi:hypothetical protein